MYYCEIKVKLPQIRYIPQLKYSIRLIQFELDFVDDIEAEKDKIFIKSFKFNVLKSLIPIWETKCILRRFKHANMF